MKTQITILFNGPHLAYSPTVIGLYDLLAEHFNVEIIARNPEQFNNKPLPNRNVTYIKEISSKYEYRLKRVLYFIKSFIDKEIALIKKNKLGSEVINEHCFIRNHLKKKKRI